MNETTDKELFNLPENYEELYGLNHITFEIPYDLFKKNLKRKWSSFICGRLHESKNSPINQNK